MGFYSGILTRTASDKTISCHTYSRVSNQGLPQKPGQPTFAPHLYPKKADSSPYNAGANREPCPGEDQRLTKRISLDDIDGNRWTGQAATLSRERVAVVSRRLNPVHRLLPLKIAVLEHAANVDLGM